MFDESKRKLNENKYSPHALSSFKHIHQSSSNHCFCHIFCGDITYITKMGKILSSFDKVKYFLAKLLSNHATIFVRTFLFLTSHSYFLYLGISLFLSLCRNKQLEKVSGIWHSFTRKVNCRKILVVLFTEAKDLNNFSLYVCDCRVLSTLAILFARRHVLGFPSILVLATPFVASLRLNAQRILQTIYSCTINYTKQKMVGHLTSRYLCMFWSKEDALNFT